MKKRAISLMLAAVLCFFCISTAFASASGLSFFERINSYETGKFSDVASDMWYAESVIAAYELGLVKGVSETAFNPEGNIAIAEVITLASRLHKIYNGKGGSFEEGNPWYQVYVDYAVENGILGTNEFSDYTSLATRAQCAAILSRAFPETALPATNTIDDNMIPDVSIGDIYGPEIYMLYRAGVLTGNDALGTFAPDTSIQRCAVAAIVTRMADVELRKTITLKAPCEHTWDGGTIKTSATCTSEGVKVFSCTLCGGTKNETLPALGHDPDGNNVCRRCGSVISVSIIMSDDDKSRADSVVALGDCSIRHDADDRYCVLLLSLTDSRAARVAAPAIVKIEIKNDRNENVYSAIKTVTTSDFGTTEFIDSRVMAAIQIFDSEIPGGYPKSGAANITVSNPGYFHFEKSLSISYGSKNDSVLSIKENYSRYAITYPNSQLILSADKTEIASWTSSNPAVATVQAMDTGMLLYKNCAIVKGISVGETMITATLTDGSKSSMVVNVKKRVELTPEEKSGIKLTLIVPALGSANKRVDILLSNSSNVEVALLSSDLEVNGFVYVVEHYSYRNSVFMQHSSKTLSCRLDERTAPILNENSVAETVIVANGCTYYAIFDVYGNTSLVRRT